MKIGQRIASDIIRRTKIVATLGPSTDKPVVLDRLIRAGLDVVRINYSHDSKDRHEERVHMVRDRGARLGREIGVIADLQGPKVRIASFREGSVELDTGDEFIIDADLKTNAGDEHHVGITYKALAKDVRKGDTLLLDDGRIILQVESVYDNAVECVVLLGGTLSNNKGLNKEGGGLSAKALTRKDRVDLRHAVEIGADYIAVSFPRNAEDIHAARNLIANAGGNCDLIAKIERREAIDNADEIIEAADGIMIARGDLGVEIGDSRLAAVQKQLAARAREMNRVVITATQMMESMITSQIPTRAEVLDVANAVLDGTDAVMLSAESSIGRHPEKAVEAMARICLGTEEQWLDQGSDYRGTDQFQRIDEAIAKSAMFAANRIGAKAIAALTETGSTCMWMSRIGSNIPIFAFTGHVSTQRKVTLLRGVYPVAYDMTLSTHDEVNADLVNRLVNQGAVENGDTVIITKGDVFGRTGGTNGMKIVRAGDSIEPVA
jgi:pyruvate kinase